MKKTPSGIMLIMLLIGMLTFTFNIQLAKASGTIYIRVDGSVEGTDEIQRDVNIYTFTGDINDSIVVERNNITIDGNAHTLQGNRSGTGIDLFGRTNVTVKNTQVKNFFEGIKLGDSSNNSVSGNNITNNCYGIYYNASSNHNSISGNNITANWWGIVLDSSSSNSISRNNITNNSDCGVSLHSSSDNSINGNNITNNGDGIGLDFSSSNSISGNNIAENHYWGIGIYNSSCNKCISGNTFTDDGLSVIDSYLNSVENNTVNGKPLVYLEGVGNYSVGDAGQVVLVRCDSIRVENLNLSRASVGIQLLETNNTIISGNNITANNVGGIWLICSSYNSMSRNDITNNRFGFGIILDHSSNSNIISRNKIKNNRDCGIGLDSSDDNSIYGNNITNNSYGIVFGFSSCNSISGNNISANNVIGIELGYSSKNIVCHNNFIDNTFSFCSDFSQNVWDDGYPSGGNYWSDYLTKYPNATEIDHTGIGNTPYAIDSNDRDHYPLMKPWASPDITVMNVTPSRNIVGQGCSLGINTTVKNQGNKIEDFNVTVYANTTEIGKQTIILTSGNSTTITFKWNTKGFAKGNYTLWAYVTPVLGETNTANNKFTYGTVKVTILGDVDGDFHVTILDVVNIASIYASKKGGPKFNPNCDLDGDGKITILDVVTCTSHYGQKWP